MHIVIWYGKLLLLVIASVGLVVLLAILAQLWPPSVAIITVLVLIYFLEAIRRA